jgi:phosphoglycerate dehydrogenase-like enzyme
MTFRCAVLDDYQGVALATADWTAAGERVEVMAVREHHTGEDEVVAALADVDAVVVMRERTPLRASTFARLPRLRLVVTTGMRNAAIDLEAAVEHGVVVCGTASSPVPPTELTWALILGLVRHVAQENAAFHTGGPWQSTVGVELSGRRLGLLGLGKIGGRVARIGAAFDMDVVAWSPHLTRERTDALGVGLAPSLDDLAATSDVLSVHLALGARTRGIFGRAQIDRMRSTAFLVNTARSAIVDGTALVDALIDGRIAGAGLDVFDEEPLPAEHVLRTLPNVLATPHVGYVAQDNYRTYFQEAVEDVAAFLAGAPVRVLSSRGPRTG